MGGCCRLLLPDSNDPLNAPGDRGITSELYGGSSNIITSGKENIQNISYRFY